MELMDEKINKKGICASENLDNELLNIWQSIITSQKTILQINNDFNIMTNTLPRTYINSSYDISNKFIQTNLLENDIDPLNKYASNLNDKQKKAYYLVCNHCQRNQPINPQKPSQLLLYLSGAGGTALIRIAATNIKGITIHSACGLGDFMQLPPVLDPALYMPDKIYNIKSSLNIQSTNDNSTPKTKKQKLNMNISSINTRTVMNTIGRNL
ncbi:5499_t:CDS:2 [Cetraspora pellucida]|uniref:5499_t:CDS:1 n=1 Tax=Cetraspora pellucida TaxID=1433469 RepID=A0A9N9EJG2_9GLOM|nr:5499_t:CDS:2 [Cetraspora pellucida]